MSVAKRETKAEKERNRNEARVGLASNILGITAGTAALATASRNKAFRSGNAADAGPVTRRIIARSKGRIGPKGVGRLVRAGAAGAVGLQAANLAGDLVANRVLARESQKKVSKVDQQTFSKAVFTRGESGHGVNLEMVEKASKKKAKCPNCEIPAGADGKCPMCGKVCSPRGEREDSKAHEARESKKHEEMEKAVRRFDSEADRQRRLGMYAAGGVGAAVAAGEATRRQFEFTRGAQPKTADGKYAKGKRPIRGAQLKPGKNWRTAAGLAALTAGSGLVGVGAYRRGVSRRNQPWA